MEIKIIHHTVDLCDEGNLKGFEYSKTDMLALGGREAGICYMAENYFSDKINNTEMALKRSNTILGTGHHSPFDHAYIGLEISGIPKILAMLLNSTEFYTTSEKSARYTVMKPTTEAEVEIYDKWRDIFREKIAELNLDMTDKEIDKLALENARYMLSVFTPTSMGFTTSFRQFSYMYYWLGELIENLEKHPNKFNSRLAPYCIELRCKLEGLTNGAIEDTKHGRFQFLPMQYGLGKIAEAETFGDIYQTNYLGSFAQLAQAQRHRTLHYEMEFSGDIPGEFGCYIPKIIRGTDYESEWVNDFERIKDQFPQCTMVKILEQGRAYWFLMKCKERLCGRAQLEIADQTTVTMQKFIDNIDNLSPSMRSEFEKCIDTENMKPVTKCQFKEFKCKEPCRWGAKHGIDRII